MTRYPPDRRPPAAVPTLAALARCSINASTAFLLFGGLLMGQGRPDPVRVSIDVKPGDEPTRIEPKRGGMLPVAVLSTPEFDAGQVDPASVQFGSEGTEAAVFRSSTEDADGDGDIDLLLLFRMQELKLECRPSGTLILKGKTQDGRRIEGRESVQMEGCG